MIYTVYCDGSLIYDPERIKTRRLYIGNPVVTLQDNSAGSFEFLMYHDHPRFNYILEQKSHVIVYADDGGIVFSGRIVEIKTDLYNTKSVYCEGDLAFLNDTVQRPHKYNGETVTEFLSALITNHNASLDVNDPIDKSFQIGTVTVTDPSGVYKYTNYESTYDVIKSDLINTYGGHLMVRYTNNVRYLDYYADYPNTNTQKIKLAKNLIECINDADHSGIFTVLIPLGATKETTSVISKRVDIKSVNNDLDYITSPVGIQTYGYIEKVVTWDDVTVPANLLSKAEQFFVENCGYDTTTGDFTARSLEVKAVDLHLLNPLTERIKLLDLVNVVSTVQGVDEYLPITEMTIYLDKPAENTLTLGSVKEGMVGQAISSNGQVTGTINNMKPLIITADGSDVTITNKTKTDICSMNLDAGIYELFGSATFVTNTTGYRDLWIVAGSGNTSDGFSYVRLPAVNGYLYEQVFGIVTLTESTTVHLYAFQNSGSSLNVTRIGIRAVKLG